MFKKLHLPTRDVPVLYLVKHPMRADLDFFCNSTEILIDELFNTGFFGKSAKGYQPAIYETQFYLKKPTFKKLTQAQIKAIVKDNLQLQEKTPGRAKDYNNFNRFEKWEVPPSKRKVAARNIKKKTTKKR